MYLKFADEIQLNMKNTMLLLLFASCFSANIYCQTTYHCLDSLFNSLYNNKQINGNVLIAEKGKIIFQDLWAMPI